jgi:hypothetical protein
MTASVVEMDISMYRWWWDPSSSSSSARGDGPPVVVVVVSVPPWPPATEMGGGGAFSPTLDELLISRDRNPSRNRNPGGALRSPPRGGYPSPSSWSRGDDEEELWRLASSLSCLAVRRREIRTGSDHQRRT